MYLFYIQSNFYTTATLDAVESSRCREVAVLDVGQPRSQGFFPAPLPIQGKGPGNEVGGRAVILKFFGGEWNIFTFKKRLL